MKRSEFSEWCRAGVRLLDGATGTNLMRAGMPRGVCTEQWVLEHPQTILKLQRDYAAAGSEVLYVLPYGMVLTVLGEGENGFLYVQWGGYTGYVSGDYVTPFGAQ